MKVLLIGMDGCHKEVFQRGWTPHISKLHETRQHLNIVNDLLSRGWLEISLGQHASVTSALYDKPKSNGSLAWKTEFSILDVPDAENVKPLWTRLNEAGYSVGVMNVPTSFPAPHVNGFFVSGGGGGAPVTEDATEELIYPPEILPVLQEHGYIVDNRLYELVVDKQLETPAKIFKRLKLKNERRTNAFVALNKKYDVDFGFIVFKTASVLAETFLTTESVRRQNMQNAGDESLINAIRDYYQNFDAQVTKLTDLYPDAEIIFVSDHGTTQRTHTVNPNILLQQNGFQNVTHGKSVLKGSISKFKEMVPFWLKAYLKKSSLSKIKDVGQINFNTETSRAFCKTQGDWTHGIYINDQDRFGGPVTQAEIDSIKEQIVTLINSDPTAQQHGIKAIPTAKVDGAVLTYFPDIQVSVPNGYLTSDKGKSFVSEYVGPVSKSSLASIMKGDILSIKSHSPIASISTKMAAKFSADQLSGDLTVVYDRVIDMMSLTSEKR